MKKLKQIAESVASILIIPFLPKLSILVGLPAFSILFLGTHVTNRETVFNIEVPFQTKIILFIVLAVCLLPWFALLLVHVGNRYEKSRIGLNPNSLADLRERFRTGAELEPLELDVIKDDIAARLVQNRTVSIDEEAFYLLQNPHALEKFLFDASTEKLCQMFDYFAKHLDDSNFQMLFQFTRQTIPNKLENLLRKGAFTTDTFASFSKAFPRQTLE